MQFLFQPIGTLEDNVVFPNQPTCCLTDRWPTPVRDSHVFVENAASLEGWLVRRIPMGFLYRWFGRPLLRFQDSERAHHRSLALLRLTASNPLGRLALRTMYKPRRRLPVTVFGHTYDHPFGLAAGMDKNATALGGWESVGLAFIEIGGVTMLQQDGNPKPRMFRADVSKALVNRMGFNNAGSEAIAAKLGLLKRRGVKHDVPLWANLGKSKLTPLDDAHIDYATSLTRLWNHVDVFVINVSSPNTPQLRTLQNDDHLVRILMACHEANAACAEQNGRDVKPILVKIAPDLDDHQLQTVVHTAKGNGGAGIVVSNTTVSRPEPAHPKEKRVFAEQGGLSGQPVKGRSTDLIRQVRQLAGPEWPIVGVGGVASADDAWEKISAGATLVQAYSGFVFEGPALTKAVVHGLHRRVLDSNCPSIQDAVGRGHDP